MQTKQQQEHTNKQSMDPLCNQKVGKQSTKK